MSIIYIFIVKNIFSTKKISYYLERWYKYGDKTSNRVINDNIDDFNRKYGRCEYYNRR